MDRYRVLSLDGGGSWALIQVKALIELYGPDAAGREVLRDFNLVAANSGGSIVLGCLLENFTGGRDLRLRRAVAEESGSQPADPYEWRHSAMRTGAEQFCSSQGGLEGNQVAVEGWRVRI